MAQKAMHYLEKAYRIDPSHREAQLNMARAMTLANASRHQSAMHLFDAMLEKNPYDTEIWQEKGSK
jgi:cytochrome c-type biogenesis protein CcmH/NrfG